VFSGQLRSQYRRSTRAIATARSTTGRDHPLIDLQRTAGNRAVARLIQCQRAVDASPENGLASGEQLIIEGAGPDTGGSIQRVGPTQIPFQGHGPGGQACQISGTLNVPSGVVPATMPDGHKLTGGWFMSADFVSPAGCGPHGEYRQFISGTVTRNGVKMPGLWARMDGKQVPEDDFIEDMGIDGVRYGRHKEAAARSRFSNPDQDTGRHWDGDDHPSVTSIGAPPGTVIAVDFLYEGRLVNTDTGATIESKSWEFKGSGRTT
jgi:hypothetical protein